MRAAVIDPYIPKSNQHNPSGYRSALAAHGPFDLIEGHFPYGVHYLYGLSKPRYFTMLRDPVDRAVSHYYFIKACDGPSYVHPRLDDVKENSLVELYRKPNYQNMQTRFVAGLGWEYAGRFLSLNGWGRWALKRAKKNLTRQYEAFGLKERFEESAQLFATRLGVEPEWPEMHHKETPNRPAAADLGEHTRRSLRGLNALDVELYDFAAECFDQQRLR
jgi:hypothetical protein